MKVLSLSFILLLFIIFSGCLNSKKDKTSADNELIDSAFIDKISKQIIKETLLESYGVETDSACIYSNDLPYALSCISAESKKEWICDFNKDGQIDILYRLIDEGLGGGGNAFSYNFVIAIIKNKELHKTLSIFGGGKMSLGLLDIDTITDGKILGTYEENSYGNLNMPNESELHKIQFSFAIENNRIVEESYKNCPLAKMDKRIFKETDKYKVERNLTMNDLFEEEMSETLILEDGRTIYATLSGCENIDLYYTRTIAFNKKLEEDKECIHQELEKNIEFLMNATRYTATFKDLLNKFKQIKPNKINISEGGGTKIEINLENNWSCNLFVSGNKLQGSFITIRFTKADAGKDLDFWEILQRRKNLNEKDEEKYNSEEYWKTKIKLMHKISFDKLKLDLSLKETMKILGKPDKITKTEMSECDGEYYQDLYYRKKGIELTFIGEKDKSKIIDKITIKPPCKFKTKKKIGIGSSYKAVMEAYKDFINPNESGSTFICIGDMYGGIEFRFENNKVNEIYVGEACD